jgi:hypothetical protein
MKRRRTFIARDGVILRVLAVLHFDRDDTEITVTDVRNVARLERRQPESGPARRVRSGGTGIHQHTAIGS